MGMLTKLAANIESKAEEAKELAKVKVEETKTKLDEANLNERTKKATESVKATTLAKVNESARKLTEATNPEITEF